jgi:hypothetical protein
MHVALIAAVLSTATYPTGWVYVEEEGIDTAPGAYHDTVSDAFIQSEVGFPHLHQPWADAAAKLPGSTTTKARVGIFDVMTVGRESDKKGCKPLVYRMTDPTRADVAWSLRFDACSDEQYQRASAMVEWLVKQGWPPPNEPPPRYLTKADFSPLRPGMSWDDVRKALGPSGRVDRGASGGFVVGYEVHRDEMLLAFGRDRRLTKIDRRTR